MVSKKIFIMFKQGRKRCLDTGYTGPGARRAGWLLSVLGNTLVLVSKVPSSKHQNKASILDSHYSCNGEILCNSKASHA